MNRFRSALGVSLLLLTACSHEQIHVVNVEDLSTVQTKKLHPTLTIPLELHETIESHGIGPSVIAFDLSQDGKSLLAILGKQEQDEGGAIRSVQWLELYDLETGAVIHQEKPDNSSEVVLSAGGFLDSRHYYVVSTQKETQNSGLTEIFTTDLHRKLEHLPVSGVTHGQGDYLFTPSMSSLVDWKTGETYRTQFYPRLGIQLMTEAGAVLSTNMAGSIVLNNPVLGDFLQWDSGFEAPSLLLTSNNYVIAQDDDFRCKVWKLPDIELVSQCPGSSGSKAPKRAKAAHPRSPLIALAWDNTVSLFTLDPFIKTQEILIPDGVLGLSFTNDRLIIESHQGLHIWDIESASLIAKAEVPIPDWNRLRVSGNGVVALLLDQGPINSGNDVRSVWIFQIP